MRFQNKKVSARATALALALGVVGVLVTALPAFAATPTSRRSPRHAVSRGTTVTITGTNFRPRRDRRSRSTGRAAAFTVTSATSITATVPCGATTGAITSS